jgi:hypothetical protein
LGVAHDRGRRAVVLHSSVHQRLMRMERSNWTREELIIAFNLYCRIPFGRIHIRNPQIVELARVLGRTPSAVSWKLANFARLDPSLQGRSISGATHGAKLEEAVWREFNENWDKLAFESEQLLARRSPLLVTDTIVDDFPQGQFATDDDPCTRQPIVFSVCGSSRI